MRIPAIAIALLMSFSANANNVEKRMDAIAQCYFLNTKATDNLFFNVRLKLIGLAQQANPSMSQMSAAFLAGESFMKSKGRVVERVRDKQHVSVMTEKEIKDYLYDASNCELIDQ